MKAKLNSRGGKTQCGPEGTVREREGLKQEIRWERGGWLGSERVGLPAGTGNVLAFFFFCHDFFFIFIFISWRLITIL